MKLRYITTLVIFVLILFQGLSIAAISPSQKYLVEIKNTFDLQKKALNEFKIDQLKSLYAENYTSNDGHTKENLFNLLQDTWENHPDIKYDMSINKISVNGDFARVKTLLKTTATTADTSKVTNDNGILMIDSETIFHVKRIGNNWKIYAEETLSEKIALLYGACKNMDIKFYAPGMVRANSEYTASLHVPQQYSKFAMGAIKNEIITYPEVESKDIFRAIDSSGVLERILIANHTNHNETVSAYVAFTEPYFNKGNNVDLRVSGLALLMKRVNVVPLAKNLLGEDKK